MHTNTTVALKPNFMSSCYYLLYYFDKDSRRFAFHIIGRKCCLHPYAMLKLSKTTSCQNFDCITLQ